MVDSISGSIISSKMIIILFRISRALHCCEFGVAKQDVVVYKIKPRVLNTKPNDYFENLLRKVLCKNLVLNNKPRKNLTIKYLFLFKMIDQKF